MSVNRSRPCHCANRRLIHALSKRSPRAVIPSPIAHGYCREPNAASGTLSGSPASASTTRYCLLARNPPCGTGTPTRTNSCSCSRASWCCARSTASNASPPACAQVSRRAVRMAISSSIAALATRCISRSATATTPMGRTTATPKWISPGARRTPADGSRAATAPRSSRHLPLSASRRAAAAPCPARGTSGARPRTRPPPAASGNRAHAPPCRSRSTCACARGALPRP